MSTTRESDFLLALSEMELLSVLALRRLPSAQETWPLDTKRSARLALRSLHEFNMIHSSAPFAANRADDLTTPADRRVIAKVFCAVLDRFPSTSEVEIWMGDKDLDLGAIFRHLFFSSESAVRDGLQNDLATLRVEMQRKQLIANYTQFDVYAQNVCNRDKRLADTDQPLPTNVRIALNLFTLSPAEIRRIEKAFDDGLGRSSISVEIVTSADICTELLDQFDIYITNNNYLYQNYDAQANGMRNSRCTTVCWHWDNHHMFEMNATIINLMDYVFPAHSNGVLSLTIGSAVTGQVIPCCVFQWTSEEAAGYFAKLDLSAPRKHNLYGRFNSYPGRVGLRDHFLRKVSDGLHDNEVHVVPHQENRWMSKSAEERFAEMCEFKIVLCNPIYGDVPARVYDALLAGAIPILPYGLPDIDIVFSPEQRRALPILTYIPDDLPSLSAACEEGIAIFDAAGPEGVLARHEVVLAEHMVANRIIRIIDEVMLCERRRRSRFPSKA